MREPKKPRDPAEVELFLSRALQIGVLLSAAVILTGLTIFLITGQSGYAGNRYPTNFAAIIGGVAALRPYAIILTGLFLLILTPIFRVGISILIFFRERDFAYVGITALVFVILIVSMLLGKAG